MKIRFGDVSITTWSDWSIRENGLQQAVSSLCANPGRNARFVVLRLALATSVGFSAATAVPIWVGNIGHNFDWPVWVGGLIATLQLGCAAAWNVLTPWIFKSATPRILGAVAAGVGILGNLLALIPDKVCFVAGCLVCGSAFGVLLNASNLLIARTAAVQRAYAAFQMTEVLFSMGFYLLAPPIAQRFGSLSIFGALAALSALAVGLLWSLPKEPLTAQRGEARLSPAKQVGAAAAVLLSLTTFFIGQNVANSFLITIGSFIALSQVYVGRVMAFGIMVGLLGALAARLLGDKLGILLPVVGSSVILAADLLVLTRTGSVAIFTITAMVMYICTVFALPYFLTKLALLGDDGRWASIGPAFILSGVAAGPSVGAYALSVHGLSSLGLVASSLILVSACAYSVAHRLTRARDRIGEGVVHDLDRIAG